MRTEFLKMNKMGVSADGGGGGDNDIEDLDPEAAQAARARRNSVASKRQSMIRLISESESTGNVHQVPTKRQFMKTQS